MISRRILFVIGVILSLLAAGCEALNPSDDEVLVSVVSTQVNALPSIYQWLFDNESGCAIEIVVGEATLAQAEGTPLAAQLTNWRPIIVPAASHNNPVDSLVLGPDYDGSFPWPLTLTEYVAPDGTADPACDWLPQEVAVQGPQAGTNAVTSVIKAQGTIENR